MKNLYSALVFAAFLTANAVAQNSGGGAFTLEQAALAGGGASSGAGNFKIEGTIGQAGAGIKGTNAAFISHNGFWTPALFSTTAATVKISGRVLFGEMQGISGATVILRGATLSSPRAARTNSFGNFEFEDVAAGQFYIVGVQHKKYGFAQDTQSFTVFEEIADIVFRADWQN